MSNEARPFAEMILEATQRVSAARRPPGTSLRQRLNSLDSSRLPGLWKQETEAPAALDKIAASIRMITALKQD